MYTPGVEGTLVSLSARTPISLGRVVLPRFFRGLTRRYLGCGLDDSNATASRGQECGSNKRPTILGDVSQARLSLNLSNRREAESGRWQVEFPRRIRAWEEDQSEQSL